MENATQIICQCAEDSAKITISGLLYCRTCKGRFSERKGTPLFRMKLEDKKAISLLEHISEGCGVRKTERLVGVNRNTVMRYCRLAGKHAKTLHDELVAFSPENQ